MLEKIKTLLDSGCWVEVEVEKNPKTGLKELVKILGYNDIHEKIILFTDGAEIIYIKGMEIFLHFDEIIEITSIKPIAKPLYQYKIGDKVVVLDNYEVDKLKGMVGRIWSITRSQHRVLFYSTEGPIVELIDTRHIAPVLD